MHKFLMTLRGAVMVLALVASVAALYVQLSGIPRYDVERVDIEIQVTPERVARGRTIATLVCASCHLDTSTGRLSGKPVTDVPREFGVAYSQNITRHQTKGIGAWSAGELAYFLRTGVRPNGQYAPPWMPKLPHLSDEDLSALIAFLHSEDPLVAATDVEAPPAQPSFLLKVLCHTTFKKLPYPKARIEAPPLAQKRQHGRYLVAALDCYSCHSADFKTVNIQEPEMSVGYLGGGNRLLDQAGQPIWSANITADEETGIGRWSEAEFVRTLRMGVRPNNALLRYPMLPMPQLSEAEASAIFAYLISAPKIRNRVVRESPQATANLAY